jgi:hypothetical protein
MLGRLPHGGSDLGELDSVPVPHRRRVSVASRRRPKCRAPRPSHQV